MRNYYANRPPGPPGAARAARGRGRAKHGVKRGNSLQPQGRRVPHSRWPHRMPPRRASPAMGSSGPPGWPRPPGHLRGVPRGGRRTAHTAAADCPGRCRAPGAASGLRTRHRAQLGVLDSAVRVCPQPVRAHPGACRRAPRHRRHAGRHRNLPAGHRRGFLGQPNRTRRRLLRQVPCRPGRHVLRVRRGGRRGADAVALPTAAVVYDTEVLPAGSIPAESFDRKVDAALTPGGIIRLG